MSFIISIDNDFLYLADKLYINKKYKHGNIMKRFISLFMIFNLLSMNTFVYAADEPSEEEILRQNDARCSKEGMYWDATMGRCLISTNNAVTKDKTSQCAGLSGDEFKKCFNDNAKEQVDQLNKDGEIGTINQSMGKNSAAKIGLPLAVSLLTGYYLLLNKDKLKACPSTSLWMIFGASTASFIGEVSSQITYSIKAKDLAKKYKDRMTEYESQDTKYQVLNNNQMMAFEYMLENEKARLAAERIRKGTYYLATTLYGAALVTVGIEALTATTMGKPSGCDSNLSAHPEVKGVTPLKSKGINQPTFDPPKVNIDIKSKSTGSIDKNTEKSFQYMQAIDKDFSQYYYIENPTLAELTEIVLRKVYNNIIPSAYAQDANQKKEDKDEDKKCNNNEQIGTDGKCATIVTADKKEKSKFKVGDLFGWVSKIFPFLSGNKKKSTAGSNNTTGAGADATTSAGVDGGKAIGEKSKNFLDRAVKNLAVRAGFATVLGGYALHLAKQAERNVETLKKRIAAIEELQSDFKKSGGVNGYNVCNMEAPEEGEPSECKEIRTMGYDAWKKSNYNLLGQSGYTPIKTCVNKSNEIDTFCNCKNQKATDGSGGNNCVSIGNSFTMGSLSGASWASSLQTSTNNLLNGNLSGADLDTADLTNKSFALSKQVKKMEKDPETSKFMKDANDIGLKIQKANESAFNSSYPSGFSSPLASFGTSDAIPTSVADVEKEVKKKLANMDAKFTKGQNATSVNSKKKNMDLDWGSEAGSAGVKIDDIASIMEKEYKIEGDINKNSDQDIFQILSLRYQRSGLRRLFDTDGTSSVDQAAETDINGK